jgi:uncharacterized protein (TIRG00374 family)
VRPFTVETSQAAVEALVPGRQGATRFYYCARIGFVLAAGALLLWMVDLQRMRAAFANLTATSCALATVLFFLDWVIGISKWKLLLPQQRWWTLARFYFVGLFYSQILPGQLAGEAVKAYRLGADTAGVDQAAASVLVDRLTGLIGLLVVAVAGIAFSGAVSAQRQQYLLLLVIGLAAMIAALFAIRFEPFYRGIVATNGRMEKLPGRIGGLAKGVHRLLAAWHEYANDYLSLSLATILGIVFQLIGALIVAILAAGLGYPIDYVDACWVLGVVSVAVLLPVSVGGLGVREMSFVGMLHLLQVPTNSGLALGLICSALTLVGAMIGFVWDLAVPASKGPTVPVA